MPFQSGEQSNLASNLQNDVQGAVIESGQPCGKGCSPACDTEGEAWWEVVRSVGLTLALLSSLFGLLVSSVQHFCHDDMLLLGSKHRLSLVLWNRRNRPSVGSTYHNLLWSVPECFLQFWSTILVGFDALRCADFPYQIVQCNSWYWLLSSELWVSGQATWTSSSLGFFFGKWG